MAEVEHSIVLECRTDGTEVLIEPPEHNGVRGFTIRMSPDRAKEFGYKLIGLSTQLRAPAGSKLKGVA
jgi:hypothetical protein